NQSLENCATGVAGPDFEVSSQVNDFRDLHVENIGVAIVFDGGSRPSQGFGANAAIRHSLAVCGDCGDFELQAGICDRDAAIAVRSAQGLDLKNIGLADQV